MAAQAYRIMPISDWRGGHDAVAPVVTQGLSLLRDVLLHVHALPQTPADIRVREGWLEVVFDAPLDPEMAEHLGLTAAE